MTQIPIWVINLAQSKDRWGEISGQLDEFGLSYERREACYGKGLTNVERHKICPTMTLNLKKRRPFDGEIGCYISHIRCFEEIVEKKLERVCILEDDAILESDFVDWVKVETPMPVSCDILKLGGLTRKGSAKNFLLKRHNRRNMVFIKNLNPLTIGYVITLSGAKKALKRLSKMRVPIDLALFEYWNSGICTVNIMPFPVKFPPDIDTTIVKKYQVHETTPVSNLAALEQSISKLGQSVTKDLNRYLYPLLWFGTSALTPSIPLQDLIEEVDQ